MKKVHPYRAQVVIRLVPDCHTGARILYKYHVTSPLAQVQVKLGSRYVKTVACRFDELANHSEDSSRRLTGSISALGSTVVMLIRH